MPQIKKSEVAQAFRSPEVSQMDMADPTALAEMVEAFHIPAPRKPGTFESLYNGVVDPFFLYDAQGVDMHKVHDLAGVHPDVNARFNEQLNPGYGVEQNATIPEGFIARRNAEGNLELAAAPDRAAVAPSHSPVYNAAVGLGHFLGLGTGTSAVGDTGAASQILHALTEGGDMGTFMGARAPGAPLKNLPQATELIQKGYDPKDVWGLYGWSPSVTNEPLWELSDAPARLHPEIEHAFSLPNASGTSFNGKLEDLLYHPELMDNLPLNLRQLPTKLSVGKDYPRGGQGVFWSNASTPMGQLAKDVVPTQIEVQGRNPQDILSVLLHETQHGVQGNEGRLFRAGGPNQIKAMILKALEREPDNAMLGRPQDADLNAWGIYKRQAHEVEARNVQRRQNMNVLDRRQKAPWETQDVPYDQQLLGFKPLK
jgi:hypothetical protein